MDDPLRCRAVDPPHGGVIDAAAPHLNQSILHNADTVVQIITNDSFVEKDEILAIHTLQDWVSV